MSVNRELTDAEIEVLANHLGGTTMNIYRECETLFSVPADDTTFDRLRKHSNLWRCVECNCWQYIPVGDTCDECSEFEE